MQWNPGNPVELTTENYLIRSMRTEDITDRYVEWWTDPEIWAGTPWPLTNMKKEDHIRRLKQQFDNGTNFQLGVFDKANGVQAGFFAIFLKPNQRFYSCNVIIAETEYWGRKVVIEAGAAIIDFSFDNWPTDRIMIEAIGRNMPTIFNLKALGFVYEGTLRQEWRYPDGRRADVVVFGLLRDEWRARREADALTA